MKDWRGKYKEREKSGMAPSVDPPRANIHYVFICARLPHMISGCPVQWFGRQPPPSTQAPVFLWPFQPIVEERSQLWRAMRLQCNLSVWSVHGSALSWSGVSVIKVYRIGKRPDRLQCCVFVFQCVCVCVCVAHPRYPARSSPSSLLPPMWATLIFCGRLWCFHDLLAGSEPWRKRGCGPHWPSLALHMCGVKGIDKGNGSALCLF